MSPQEEFAAQCLLTWQSIGPDICFDLGYEPSMKEASEIAVDHFGDSGQGSEEMREWMFKQTTEQLVKVARTKF